MTSQLYAIFDFGASEGIDLSVTPSVFTNNTKVRSSPPFNGTRGELDIWEKGLRDEAVLGD